MNFTYVVIGGGIAGVECVETLTQQDPNQSVLLVSESCLIKSTINLVPVTKLLTKFDVCEIDLQSFQMNHSNVIVLHDSLVTIDSQQKFILTSQKKSEKIFYQYLCLCTGARPKSLPFLLPSSSSLASKLLTIRDTDSVHDFITKIRNANRIAIIGNGGIASELVFKCDRIHIDWIIRDNYVSATFLDAAASEFLLKSLKTANNERLEQSKSLAKCTYIENDRELKKYGAALGPNWYRDLIVNGSNAQKNLQINYDCEIRRIEENTLNESLKLTVTKTSEEETILEVDLVIVAIGVEPKFNIELVSLVPSSSLQMNENGVFVNAHMETSIEDIFAAGDICYPKWDWAQNWFPMKLWTQAKQMGHYAAKCMIAKRTGTIDANLQDFCFELFSHSTTLFGFDIVLLGLFNGQKMTTNDYDCLVRCTPGNDYIKLVISRTQNCLIGAILIGDCSMAETFENLILNQLDVSIYGDDLLNPNIDIDDYFD